MKGEVSPADRFAERIAALERRLDMLDASRDLRSATIDEPGSLQVRDSLGNVRAFFGALETVDGTFGIELRRADGSRALTFEGLTNDPTFHETVRMFDRAGNVLLEDDETGGQGLSRPYLTPLVTPTANAIQSTTDHTMTDLHDIQFFKQHPKIEIEVAAYIDVAGTTGEVDLYDINLGAVVVGPTAFSSSGVIIPLIYSVPGVHMTPQALKVRARVTSAGGSVGAQVYFATTRG